MATYLVTGCSRGLGLELIKQLAAKPISEVKSVIATGRSDDSGMLADIVGGSNGRVHFIQLDVTSEESAKAAAATAAGLVESIDMLFNNAGTISWMAGGIETMDDLSSILDTNVNGVQIVTSAFVRLVKDSQIKKVVNLSTSVGSIRMSPTYAIMPVPAYKVSKAALNMLTVQWALTYGKEHGITFLSISPGWLRTDLGGSSADLSVEEGATAVLELVATHGFESNENS